MGPSNVMAGRPAGVGGGLAIGPGGGRPRCCWLIFSGITSDLQSSIATGEEGEARELDNISDGNSCGDLKSC